MKVYYKSLSPFLTSFSPVDKVSRWGYKDGGGIFASLKLKIEGDANVSNNGNGSDSSDEFVDSSPEMEDLQMEFINLMQRRVEAEQSGADESELRDVREEVFKEQMRASFLTHELATDEDFERLWPRLRDDVLCENAASVYLQVIDSLAEEFNDEA